MKIIEILTETLKIDLLKSIFVFSVAAIFSANCANAQNVADQKPEKIEFLSSADLAIDEGVIVELQKRVDAKSAELAGEDEKLQTKRKAASRLEAKDVCIKRLKESPQIIVIGFFRTDAGCRFDGAFVNSRYYERDEKNLSKIALAALGWNEANQRTREKLAKIWIEKGLLAFAPLPYQKVSAISSGDGEIKITATSEYPSNVTSRNVIKRFVFDKNGDLRSADDY